MTAGSENTELQRNELNCAVRFSHMTQSPLICWQYILGVRGVELEMK